MKLEEIFEHIIPLNLNEVFDTKIDVYQWKQKTPSVVWGYLDIDGRHFAVIIEDAHYTMHKNIYPFINVSFAILDEDDNPSEELTFANISPSKVIGAVANTIVDYISKRKPLIIMMMATDHVEKRMNIYNTLARHFGQNFGKIKTGILLPEGRQATLVFSSKVPDDVIKQFEQFISTRTK